MVIVDSSVWIDFFHGIVTPETAWLRRALPTTDRIGLTSLIYSEVLQGIRTESRYRLTREYLTSLPIFEACSAELAAAAATHYRLLRSRGITVRSTVDALIATFCLQSGYQLLHRDRDFDAFERHLGLKVKKPPALS